VGGGKPKIKRSAACSLSGKHKDPSERIKGSTRLEVGVSEFVSRVQTQLSVGGLRNGTCIVSSSVRVHVCLRAVYEGVI